MRFNKLYPEVVFAVLIIAAAALVTYLTSCAPTFKAPPAQPPAVQLQPITPAITVTRGKVEAIAPPLAAATQRAEKINSANVEQEKPGLPSELRAAWDATLAAIKSARDLETKANASDKANAESFKREQAKDKALDKAAETITQQNAVIAEKDEKIRQFANDRAMLALSLALGFCVLLSAGGGFVLYSGQRGLGVGMMIGGAVGVTLAILAMTLQHFAYTHETELGYGVCGLAVIGLAIGGYLAYRRMHESTLAATKVIQAGAVAGAIDMTKLAPIARAIETPLLAKIVNKTTSKEDREAAADVDGPLNVTTTAPAAPPAPN